MCVCVCVCVFACFLFSSALCNSFAVSELEPNEVVWAKFRKFPHWPALVGTGVVIIN